MIIHVEVAESSTVEVRTSCIYMYIYTYIVTISTESLYFDCYDRNKKYFIVHISEFRNVIANQNLRFFSKLLISIDHFETSDFENQQARRQKRFLYKYGIPYMIESNKKKKKVKKRQ